MDTLAYPQCVCKRMPAQNPALCSGPFTFAEKGKKVRLTPGPDEQVLALVLDGCVLTDNQPKCDGLFLWCGRGKGAAILIELKGTDLGKGFEQLAYVLHHRPEYRHLRQQLADNCTGPVKDKAFMITSAPISYPQKEALEERYGIRVAAILHSDASSKIPELRTRL